MKSQTLILASLGLGLLAGSLLAQPQKRPPQQKPSPIRMLDLTEEQQAKIQMLRLQLEKDLLPLRSK